ncbi:MAG: hypothetical protein ACLQNE_29245 [Thermoguttaceae bacterium]|jgi:hypothetical protein
MQETSQEASAAAACGCWVDPVIEVFKRDVDRTLLREALKMTPGDRLMNLQRLCECAEELRQAGQKAKAQR